MSRDGRTAINYIHTCDVYEKTYEEGVSGQRKPTWSRISEGQKCWYVPQRAVVRVNPTSEETEKVIIWFPADIELNYGSRIENLRTRFGDEVFAEGKQFQIMEVRKFSNLRGKITQVQVKANTVIE